MNVLALVTDAFGGFGGIAQYNRDLLTALVRGRGGGRVVVLPRHGSADHSALPVGVRQLESKALQRLATRREIEALREAA